MKKTHIVVVLDRSGSMASCKADTIGGFNTLLEDQQKQEGEAVFTLTQFDTEYDIVYNGVDIKKVKPLDGITFVPRGATALLDAIGRTIEATKAVVRPGGGTCKDCPDFKQETGVVFVVITDGEENSSQEFNHDQIMNMIKQCREQFRWEFVFLGAQENAIQQGVQLGFYLHNTARYSSSEAGTQNAYVTVSNCVSSYRSGGELSSFSDEDRKDMLKD